MDKFLVHGGRQLSGTVAVSGSKNAVLPMMAACLMADGTTTLARVPDLADVETLSLVLGELGVYVQVQGAEQPGDGCSLQLRVVDEAPRRASYDLVRRMRASVCVLGPLLAKRGRASVSLPGGCNLGHRPIELHLKGLRALGAEIEIRHGYVEARAERLHGANIYLGGAFGSTVTGTCNVMMAATLAEGTTVIESAACEPEVVDLGRLLCRMGAKIEGLGTPRIVIEGVRRLQATDYRVAPDRIEAATLIIAAAMVGKDVRIKSVPLRDLTAVVEKLREMGVAVDVDREASGKTQTTDLASAPPCTESKPPSALDSRLSTLDSEISALNSNLTATLRVSAPDRLRPADVIALPYPGVPTDVQAQMTALLCRAEGISIVTDKVFPDRFMHVAELSRLGAQIRREGPCAIISGVSHLSGAGVMASDLRASAALVLAGLAAEGTTTVRRIYHLDRGYEGLDAKLCALGAHVERVPDAPESDPSPERVFQGPHRTTRRLGETTAQSNDTSDHS